MKIIRVECCNGCQNSDGEMSSVLKEYVLWCRKLGQRVKSNEIHPDCPLENAKEELVGKVEEGK